MQCLGRPDDHPVAGPAAGGAGADELAARGVDAELTPDVSVGSAVPDGLTVGEG